MNPGMQKRIPIDKYSHLIYIVIKVTRSDSYHFQWRCSIERAASKLVVRASFGPHWLNEVLVQRHHKPMANPAVASLDFPIVVPATFSMKGKNTKPTNMLVHVQVSNWTNLQTDLEIYVICYHIIDNTMRCVCVIYRPNVRWKIADIVAFSILTECKPKLNILFH